jgi:formylglycine-generating enzyme required for sulfatase activity
MVLSARITVFAAFAFLEGAAFAGQPVAREGGDGCRDSLPVSVGQLNTRVCIKLGSGESFKDCPDCPEMVAVPAGSFMMGSAEGLEGNYTAEKPQHEVTIGKPFAAGRFAVTFAEWDACMADGGCNGYKPRDNGWGRDDRPVIHVTWSNAKAYVAWLSKRTGKEYRLLSEAEREYVTRAGTQTPFWWGTSITPEQANYDGSAEPYKGGGWKGEYRHQTVPVKSFAPNPWGLYQVHGNVWEWVEDCWHHRYSGAPTDGSAVAVGECRLRPIRGGSWYDKPEGLRSATRLNDGLSSSYGNVGFRVARTIYP